MIDVKKILNLQHNAVINWHSGFKLTQTEIPYQFIEENHKWNFSLWHEEDIARVKDIDDARIVKAKRNIDVYNQSRNNAIEKIDEWILSNLHQKKVNVNENMHSETPGMIIDRLSIMALKRFHMLEETVRTDAPAAHKTLCATKVKVLNEQISDLADCLEVLFKDLKAGKIQFKVYRQFKMYNDPSLNPELYKRTK